MGYAPFDTLCVVTNLEPHITPPHICQSSLTSFCNLEMSKAKHIGKGLWRVLTGFYDMGYFLTAKLKGGGTRVFQIWSEKYHQLI